MAPGQQFRFFIFLFITFLLAACSSGGGGDDNGDDTTNTPDPTYSIGGSVNNLQGSGLVLQINGGGDIAIASTGTVDFTFATELADGENYAVTVLAQPSAPDQNCIVTSGAGVIAGTDVSNININCVSPAATNTVGGTVSGLVGTGLVLQNSNNEQLAVSGSGDVDFTFLTPLMDGDSYAVTVLTQPSAPNQICTVTNGTGVIAGANVTNISINCVTQTYTIGGTVSGLAGSGLVLQNSNNEQLAVNGSGDVDFTFATPLIDGDSYAVTVLTQPSAPLQTCTVTNGSGAVAGANVTSISINCVTQTYTIGGTVTGLAGSGLVLQNSNNEQLAVNGTGSVDFTFTVPVADGDNYNVTVLTEPSTPDQTCVVTNGSGTIAGANVTNISLACGPRTFSIGGTVTNLAGSGLVLQNSNNEQLAVNGAGNIDFTFATQLDNGANYDVTVLTQPSSPGQVCTVFNGAGSVTGANVTNITVTCVTDTYTISGTITGLEGSNLGIENSVNNNGINISGTGTVNFVMSRRVDDGSAYNIAVRFQPTTPEQICTVSNGTGVINGGDITNVAVSCTTLPDGFYSISGTVNWLDGSGLTLQNNGGDNVLITGSGTVRYTFPTGVADGADYNITVLTQPTNLSQSCSILFGSGTIAGASITNANFYCYTSRFSIGGTITNLRGSGLVLQNNSDDDTTIWDTGSVNFSMNSTQLDGSDYNITVLTQPSNPPQDCTVTNGSGTLAGADVADIAINCTTESYTVGGTVTGLVGSGLVLQNNSGDDLTITGNGDFTFATPVEDGLSYEVTVLTHPESPPQDCVVTNSSGTIATANVTDIVISCTDRPRYTVSGTVIGLTGTGLTLQNNGGDDLVINGSGTVDFSFSLPVVNGLTYDVTVANQPDAPAETCTVTDGSGTIADANIDNVLIHCPFEITWANPTMPSLNLFRVRWVNGQFFVFGEQGLMLTSTDGASWSTKYFEGLDFNDITWTGSQYVATGGPDGDIYTSSDANNWTQQNKGTANGLGPIVWTGSQLVAGGGGGTIVTSPNGINWTPRTSNTSQNIATLFWNGSQLLGGGWSVVLLSDANGVAWIPAATGSGWGVSGFAWSGSQFIGVGSVCGSLCVWPNDGMSILSSNGLNWGSLQNLSISGLFDVEWIGGQFVAVGPDSLIASSTTGLAGSWVTRSAPVSNTSLNSIAWNGTTAVAVGYTGKMMSSPNGNDWTNVNTAVTTNRINKVSYNGSQYVAVGGGNLPGTATPVSTLLTSSNGIDWTEQDAGTSSFLLDAVWTGTQWVVTGSSGTIITSTNGVDWFPQTSGVTVPLVKVYWDGARVFALGSGGTILTSPDGSVWTPRTSGVTNTLNDMVHTGSQHVIVADRRVLTSSDGGDTWDYQIRSENLSSIVWTGQMFVAGGSYGSSGRVLTSADGTNWDVQDFGSRNYVNDISWNGDFVSLITNGGRFYVSLDGLSWSSQFTTSFDDILWVNDRFFMNGMGGAIVYGE